jgi:hypothetical protein
VVHSTEESEPEPPAAVSRAERVLVELDKVVLDGGSCFRIEIAGADGDSHEEPRRSAAQLLENGVALGPAHASHDAIRRKGKGRFSHWGDALYFSTSDNSDPNTNGRRYALWLPSSTVASLRYPAPAQRQDRVDPAEATRRGQVLFEIDDFTPRRGHCFAVQLPGSEGDSDKELHRSSLRLYENGIPLGPPHANHGDIEATGGGCYSHWRETLYFSTSDNSDPRHNRRAYHVQLDGSFGESTPAARAIEFIRALPADYTPAAAYAAIEAGLAVLDPVAVLGDTRKAYWQNDRFVRDFVRVVGADRRTMERKYTVYQLMKSLYWLPGDIAECGTWNGGTAYFMALAGREVARERPFHIFDSFEGLSPPTTPDGNFWQAGDLAAPIEAVKAALIGFDDIHFYPGWIPTEFHHVADRRFCLVHIDVDLHDPTRDSLAFFYPRMVPGGIIVCDDYGSALCPGAREAIDDYLQDKSERIIDLPTMQGLIIKRPS